MNMKFGPFGLADRWIPTCEPLRGLVDGSVLDAADVARVGAEGVVAMMMALHGRSVHGAGDVVEMTVHVVAAAIAARVEARTRRRDRGAENIGAEILLGPLLLDVASQSRFSRQVTAGQERKRGRCRKDAELHVELPFVFLRGIPEAPKERSMPAHPLLRPHAGGVDEQKTPTGCAGVERAI
jgi:hypothetical protein